MPFWFVLFSLILNAACGKHYLTSHSPFSLSHTPHTLTCTQQTDHPVRSLLSKKTKKREFFYSVYLMGSSSPFLSSKEIRKEEEEEEEEEEEKMQNSNTFLRQYLEAESEDDLRFDKSLKELKDLRSQLHYAADYCERTFSNAKQRKMVLENTKEYISNAVVTVVDHLGSISANLDFQLTKNNTVFEAELRINSLKQRLFTCEQYAQKLTLSRLRLRENLPRYHPHYVSTPIPNIERSNGVLRNSDNPSTGKIIDKHELDMKEEVPLLVYAYSHKPSIAKNLTSYTAVEKEDQNSVAVLPARNGLSIFSKAPNPTFHFQSSPKRGRNMLFRKSLHSNSILLLLRRTGRTT